MDDLAAYAGLLGYLRSLSLVRDVEVESLRGLGRDARACWCAAIANCSVALRRSTVACSPWPLRAEGAAPGADFTFQP